MEYEKKKEAKASVRKFSWKEKKRFDNYESASTLKVLLLSEGYTKVKIRRAGPEGSQFKVVIGTEIKTTKKGSKNASK